MATVIWIGSLFITNAINAQLLNDTSLYAIVIVSGIAVLYDLTIIFKQ